MTAVITYCSIVTKLLTDIRLKIRHHINKMLQLESLEVVKYAKESTSNNINSKKLKIMSLYILYLEVIRIQ